LHFCWQWKTICLPFSSNLDLIIQWLSHNAMLLCLLLVILLTKNRFFFNFSTCITYMTFIIWPIGNCIKIMPTPTLVFQYYFPCRLSNKWSLVYIFEINPF
jgi:hypothetical protein